LEYRMQRGREAIGRHDYDAVDAIAEKLEAAGEADRANLLRGEALMHQERYGAALSTLNQIQEKGEVHFQSVVLSARCLLELRRLREADAVYSWVLAQDPENADAHRGVAAIAYDLGQLPRAVAHLEEVAKLDSQDGRPHRLIGLIDKDLSRFTEAAT